MSADCLTAAAAAEQRRRIKALQDDPEARAAAASARPRGPAADPRTETDEDGKAALLGKLGAMTEHSADPERAAKIERRITAAAESRKRTTGDAPKRADQVGKRTAGSGSQRGGKRARKGDAAAPSEAAQRADLLAARDGVAILAAVARLCWHDGDKCPMPTPADLAAWLNEWRDDGTVLLAARDLLRTVTSDAHADLLVERIGGEPMLLAILYGSESVNAGPPAENGPPMRTWRAGFSLLSIDGIHEAWCQHQEPRTRHPLAPLVDAWQRFGPVRVEVDRHQRAILPVTLLAAHRDQATLPLALDPTTPLGPIRAPEQGYLPGLEPPPSVVPAVSWLTLYDLTGSGPVQTRGRGAPLAQRLFVEILTAVPRDDREWTAAPPVTLRDLFEWCWPRYYHPMADRMRGGYDRSKHLEPLRRALVELDNMRIVWERWERRLIRVDDLPTATTALDEVLRFHVRHLPGSDHGPLIDRAPLRRWGVVSAPAWRAAIRLAYLWDEAKSRNHGARVYATRPVVARVAGSGSPLIGTDGKPLHDRRGAVVTDWSDRRAVTLGADGKPAGDGNPPAFERNPAADRVPVLGPDDLIRLTYDDHITRSNRRERLRSARKTLRAKQALGEVVIEAEGDGWRIIEARQPG